MAASSAPNVRANQRRRTRKDLLQAAVRLMKEGKTPTLEAVAEAALVSRATVYRYFSSVDELLAEAPLDIAVPGPDDLFNDDTDADPIVRLERVDDAIDEAIAANEASLRLMIAHSLQRRLKAGEDDVPARQNRRSPLIEAALRPSRRQFKPATFDTLSKALALVIGTEAMIVFKDVLQVDDAQARKIKRWVIRSLVDAARKSPGND